MSNSEAAIALLQQGRLDEAVASLSTAVDSSPDWFAGRMALGSALGAIGRYEDAVHHLRAAVALDATSVEAELALAEALTRGGRTDSLAEAQQHFERVVQMAPDQANSWLQLGHAYIYSSREREAEGALRRALELAPDTAFALRLLSVSLVEQGRMSEALPLLSRYLELNPGDGAAAEERERLATAVKQSGPRHLARYPRSQKDFADPQRVIEKFILSEFKDAPCLLQSNSKVFAFGSCFAVNIATTLRRYGFDTEFINYPEDINNTFENRQLVNWITNGSSTETAGFDRGFGEEYRRRIRAFIAGTDAMIFSLGVAPCFFDRDTKAPVPTFGMNFQVSLLLEQFEFRTTTVAENVDNLRYIIEGMRSLNPDLPFVLTVSPVPLKATFERDSAIMADCVSKSTLRVAAEETMRLGIPGVYYWPSFEMIRWLGGHVGQVFGNEDQSPFHPSQQMVDLIIRSFGRTFGDEAVKSMLERPAGAAAGDVPV